MEVWLQLLVAFIATVLATTVSIKANNIAIKKNKEEQKLIEEEKQDKKIYNLFKQRDKLAEKQADEIALKTKIAISEDIMPLIHKMQNQYEKIESKSSNLEEQVTILREIVINHREHSVENEKKVIEKLYELELKILKNKE